MEYKLKTPLDKSQIAKLNVGDVVYITGRLLTGRDAAHKRIFDALKNGEELPVEIEGQAIYYVGPCEKDGKVLSAGPTTSMRMDAYAPLLYDEGVVATIGKGDRNEDVYDAINATAECILPQSAVPAHCMQAKSNRRGCLLIAISARKRCTSFKSKIFRAWLR